MVPPVLISMAEPRKLYYTDLRESIFTLQGKVFISILLHRRPQLFLVSFIQVGIATISNQLSQPASKHSWQPIACADTQRKPRNNRRSGDRFICNNFFYKYITHRTVLQGVSIKRCVQLFPLVCLITRLAPTLILSNTRCMKCFYVIVSGWHCSSRWLGQGGLPCIGFDILTYSNNSASVHREDFLVRDHWQRSPFHNHLRTRLSVPLSSNKHRRPQQRCFKYWTAKEQLGEGHGLFRNKHKFWRLST